MPEYVFRLTEEQLGFLGIKNLPEKDMADELKRRCLGWSAPEYLIVPRPALDNKKPG